ncbi:Cof-type HAD-IIB family hydrolase [Granulicella aggregans]|nr:Cof-type HAD-IIB family hydrolase [Granulicella aggregans]
MIAIDVDGTLLGAEGKVSARNKAALQAANEAGIHVVIATGRRHSYAMKVLRSLNLHGEQALVSSNGAVTRTVGARLIDRTFLTLPTSLWLCEHLAEFRNALVVTFDMVQPDGEDARGSLVVEELADLHGSIGKWMEANSPYIEQSVPIEDALLRANAAGNAPIQMMVCGTIERMRRAEARLLEHPGVFSAGVSAPELLEDAEVALSRTEYPERDLSLLDILPAGCSKGVALLRLAASLGIEANEMMAIGDNWNDLSMLEIAGWPVLMGNAPEDLKEMARARGWTIGAHHLEDGVADAIDEVLSLQRAEDEYDARALSGSL